MHRSAVVGSDGEGVLGSYRTSHGTFLTRYKTPVIKAIEERVALLTHTPVSHQESMQVLRYGVNQYYHQHLDSLDNDTPRMATVLLYLSTPELGGETAFPQAINGWTDPAMAQAFGPFSDCVQGNVAFKPKRGDALLFWSVAPDGETQDAMSNHEGCPVVKGVKWTATVWVHTQPYKPEEWDPANQTYVVPQSDNDPGVCTDYSPNCRGWAKTGECEKNPDFMVGGPKEAGFCRLACGACKPCEDPADRECYNRKRQEAGYLVFDPQELNWPPAAHAGYDDGTL